METADEFASGFEEPDMVKIQLEDGGVFWVQEPILCNLSDYFRTALKGQFKESHTKTLRLPGCTTDTFKHLLFWIVNHKLEPPMIDLYDTSAVQVQLVKLWALGQEYLLPKLQNMVTDCLWQLFVLSEARPAAISEAFELTSEGSELRQLFLSQVESDVREKRGCTEEEMDQIGRVPGFTKAYIDMVTKCLDVDQKRLLMRRPTYYHVREEEWEFAR
ncbi:hypothetical protein PRZ48_007126 [Zasmidium cellare]|uniref:BTB domain-containing protein n=1 Tax=Zasmidium cellare TaxID=395010 RepID=A0ABR0EJE7_ZASCE|nr:hypothetical protein PRZ48_007126 [Zasmidium cellare]